MMILRNSFIFLILSFFIIISPNLAFSDWRGELKELKIGLAGGENEADRLKNYECWRHYLEEQLDIPVKFYPASDVAGIIHGLLGKTLDYASVGHLLMLQCILMILMQLNQLSRLKKQMDLMAINQQCMCVKIPIYSL